ncbi:MAG: helix-turn-helix transcriptional regulator [Verrucomicrobia bacterium]|nr:helix-turn-helix transcriptional regulator [Verrucomicrobiota bacterium]
MSNSQIEVELGKRLRARRLERNLSQQEAAVRAGLTRRTITAVENGEGCALATLIALLRALDSLDFLENFLPIPEISPSEMFRLQEKGVTYKPRQRKHASKPRQPAPPWVWGDEQPQTP